MNSVWRSEASVTESPEQLLQVVEDARGNPDTVLMIKPFLAKYWHCLLLFTTLSVFLPYSISLGREDFCIVLYTFIEIEEELALNYLC